MHFINGCLGALCKPIAGPFGKPRIVRGRSPRGERFLLRAIRRRSPSRPRERRLRPALPVAEPFSPVVRHLRGKSAPVGDARCVPRVLTELIACLRHEINGDHHRLALSFLAALGIEDPARIEALPVTDSYAESFLRCYSPGDRSGDEALAALAGRGLAGPGRDRIITGSLLRHYGVTSGLEFFSPLGEEEAKHSRAMWRAIIGGRRADPNGSSRRPGWRSGSTSRSGTTFTTRSWEWRTSLPREFWPPEHVHAAGYPYAEAPPVTRAWGNGHGDAHGRVNGRPGPGYRPAAGGSHPGTRTGGVIPGTRGQGRCLRRGPPGAYAGPYADAYGGYAGPRVLNRPPAPGYPPGSVTASVRPGIRCSSGRTRACRSR